jgi:hypothetical protein
MQLLRQVSLLSIVFLLLYSVHMKAQLKSTIYTDWGSTNVSDGLFIKTAVLGQYSFDKYSTTGGLQFDVRNPFQKVFTGASLHLSRQFTLRSIPLEPEIFYMLNAFSTTLHENNWGALLKLNQNHFSYKIGTHFRTYRITANAASEYGIEENRSVSEKWNLLYYIHYHLKKTDANWNAGLTATNIDHFMINQETNPVFYMNGLYKLTKPLALFGEIWYKSAGSLNISVNYFGFFIRTGIIWQPQLN